MSGGISRILGKFDAHSRELIRGSVTGFASRLAASACVFLFNVLLARSLGADQTGLYFLGIATISVVAVCSRLGIDTAVLRYAAAHAANNEWRQVAALYWRSNATILSSSAVLALLLYLTADLIAVNVFGQAELGAALRHLAFALPCVALIPLQSRFLQSIKRVAAALYTQNALIPTILLAALLFLPLDWDIGNVTVAYAGAALAALLASALIWLGHAPIRGLERSGYAFTQLRSSSLQLLPANLVNKVIQPWAAILCLGFWGTATEVGWFGTSTRTAALIAFAIVPVNAILAPKMAVLAQQNDYGALFKLARNATALIVLIAVPIVCPILLAPDLVMSLFGDEFLGSGAFLVILALGQIINVLTGPVQSILVMTGNERAHKTASMAGGAVTLTLCVILIPQYGGTGAAWTSACGFAVTNLLSTLMVWSLVWKKRNLHDQA